jgi:hypothetical protein
MDSGELFATVLDRSRSPRRSSNVIQWLLNTLSQGLHFHRFQLYDTVAKSSHGADSRSGPSALSNITSHVSSALDSHLLTTYASPCHSAESGNVQKAAPGVVLIVGTNPEDVPEPAEKLVLRF